jgi:hypothetical protein
MKEQEDHQVPSINQPPKSPRRMIRLNKFKGFKTQSKLRKMCLVAGSRIIQEMD